MELAKDVYLSTVLHVSICKAVVDFIFHWRAISSHQTANRPVNINHSNRKREKKEKRVEEWFSREGNTI